MRRRAGWRLAGRLCLDIELVPLRELDHGALPFTTIGDPLIQGDPEPAGDRGDVTGQLCGVELQTACPVRAAGAALAATYSETKSTG